MPSVRHRSQAELPPSPLEFASPLAVPDATVLGAAILHEVPGEFALHVFQALRMVFAWAAGPRVSGAVFDFTDLAAWEADVLGVSGVDEALWAPVAVIAGEVARPAELDVQRLAHACLAVTEWALDAEAHGTALLFAEAAAVVWPSNARISWLTGKLYRQRLQLGRAEMWLRRASRVAVWTADWELQARALISLGNLKVHLGDLPGAHALLLSAVRLAKRKRLRERLAMAHHDLFVIALLTGRFSEAESHAKQAFTAYGPEHPNLLRLAFDVSHWWTQQGQFSRALEVLNVLRGRFSDPERQLHVLASTARAAGALNEAAPFHEAWARAWKLIDGGVAEHLRASAALELGLGALNLGLREHAEYALVTARDTARELREGDTLAKADAALDALAHHTHRYPDWPARRAHRPQSPDFATQLARSIDLQSSEAEASRQ
jgi:tetratricopeptide (TPR) repeat protein